MRTLFCAAMKGETDALRRGLPEALRDNVLRTGRGPVRARRAALTPQVRSADSIVVAGISGGLDPALRPGDVVVADSVIGPDGIRIPCPAAPMLAARLRAGGVPARACPIATSDRLVVGSRRAVLARSGAVAVDMESAALLGRGRPAAVVRVIADPVGGRLFAPVTLRRVRAAVSALTLLGPAAADWAAAVAPRTVLLAGHPAPRPRADAWTPDAIAEIAAADLVLVVGSPESAETRRLLHSARRLVADAHAVGDVDDVDLRWLPGVATVGIVAQAPAPQVRVERIVAALGGLGATEVRAGRPQTDDMDFKLSKEVRGA